MQISWPEDAGAPGENLLRGQMRNCRVVALTLLAEWQPETTPGLVLQSRTNPGGGFEMATRANQINLVPKISKGLSALHLIYKFLLLAFLML